MGVVDEVVEDGLGEAAVRRMIVHRQKRLNTYRSLVSARVEYQPVTLEELTKIVDIWVDGALRLDARDLKMMGRLVRAQDKLVSLSPEEQAIEALYANPAAAHAA